MGQVRLSYIGDPLEVVVTGVAEVSRAKTEENSYRATVTTLILEEVCSVFRAHLKTTKTNPYKVEANTRKAFHHYL